MTIQNQGDKNFEGLVGLYLRQIQAGKTANSTPPHLDEDLLSAFIEGVLTERQYIPVIKHLIDCAFCRRVTAQLSKLTDDLYEVTFLVNKAEDNKWHKLWGNLTENISRPFNNVVVAHEQEKENAELEEKNLTTNS